MLSIEVKFGKLIDRVDANFYTMQSKTLKELKGGKIPNIIALKEICSFPRSKTPGKCNYTESGVSVIKLKNITNYFIDLNDTSFIHQKFYSSFIQPEKEDILITATGEGTIGRVGLFENRIKCIVTAEVMIIRVKDNKINPYFLFSYLRSKYGKSLIIRFVRGSTGQTHLYSKDVKLISVPIPPKTFQFNIEKLVKEAFSKRNLADQKYKEAKQLLEKELGLDKLKLKEEKTFESKSSELFESGRFDSEYYKPKYKQIVEFLENSEFEVKKLKEVVKISNKKIDPTKEPNKRFRYVPIAKINSNGEIDKWEEFSGWQAPSRAKMLIKKGDVLVSSLGGSLNKIALVPEVLNNSIATTGTFVINSENFYSEFLFLLFRTELIKLQLKQKTAGAIMTAIPKTTFGDLLIPIIPKQKQENIAELIKQSFALRKEAKQLLQEAKVKVEKMILKN